MELQSVELQSVELRSVELQSESLQSVELQWVVELIRGDQINRGKWPAVAASSLVIRWAAVAPISHNHYEFVWPAVAASSV